MIHNIGFSDYGYKVVSLPIDQAKRLGSSDPSFSKVSDNGSGSVGIYLNGFDDGVSNEVFISTPIPRDIQKNTTMYLYAEWLATTDGSAAQFVNWGVEYIKVDAYTTFDNSTIVSNNTTVDWEPVDIIEAKLKYLTILEAFDITGYEDDTSFMMRVFRDGTGSLATDNYPHTAYLLSLNFYYRCNKLGEIGG